MLLGSVGRTDLSGPWVTDRLSHLQHQSVRRLSDELPDDAAILPTHGFGSLCSAGFPVGGADTADAGHQRAENPALLMDEDSFVARLVSGLDAFPRYYAYIAPRNREGAGSVDLGLPQPSGTRELAERAGAGEWVVDLRERRAFAARHLAGTLAFELSDPLSTYLGWLLPWGSPLSLIGHSVADVASARRALARIGIEKIVAWGVSDGDDGEDPWAGVPTDPTRSSALPTSSPSSALPARSSSTSVSAASGARATFNRRCTSPSTSCPTGSTRFPRAGSGRTALPAIAPPWRGHCWLGPGAT